MALEHYISELLYRYNCVVVPGFGAFLTQPRSAVIHEETQTFYPPMKRVSFNQQLVANDGLLVSHMAEVQKTTFEDMLKQVEEEVADWISRLQNGERLELAQIGEVWSGAEGRIQFQPSGKTNYLMASYGMSSFAAVPVARETMKEEVAALEEKTPFAFTPETRKSVAARPYLKYAAVVLLALTAGVAGFQFYQADRNNHQLVREEAQQQVSKRIQEATFFDTDPLELPTITLKTTKKSVTDKAGQKIHHIIAGAFRYKTNADKRIAQLQKLGFNPSYIGTNPFGLHMVAYDSFNDAQKALSELHRVKRSQKDAWLKSVR
ncbi:SPOR domain-containing protein [Pricia sp. S334]|uniref:SPOR domain-containing protein n=1 Tax=Pricia mediterranea TaxID=3076079 RepID=A0ABU3L5I4_9FLAO|nr:SPOR domain-containing protein [Pricia sp. S334]MDT7828989.1 SPOR domain-containing protein [Pricia sp. S334]